MTKETLHTKSETVSASQKLRDIVTSRGIDMAEARLQWLMERADRFSADREQGKKSGFVCDGLTVGAPTPDADSSGTIAHLDFGPRINSRLILTPQREHLTQMGLSGIHALQNYVLLVESGALERPDILAGPTINPEIAKIAKRFGFSPRTEHSDVVTAAYDVVAAAAFSPEIQRAEAILGERSARVEPTQPAPAQP